MKRFLKSLVFCALSVWALAITVPVAAQVYTSYAGLDGSAGAPTFGFLNGTTTGMYRDSTGAIVFAVGGVPTLVIRAGRIGVSSVGAPTLSACGTTSTIVGSDTAGVIVNGGTQPATCTITFKVAKQSIPHCDFNDITTVAITQGALVKKATSLTALTVTLQGAPTAGDTFTYSCTDTS